MYEESNQPNQCYLKLYKNNDWVWIPIAMRATDVKYITKYWSHCEKSAPTLEKKYGKYFLRFAFVEKVELSETVIQDRRICAVDLGLNTDAVCSIMTADGTVLARKFINFRVKKTIYIMCLTVSSVSKGSTVPTALQLCGVTPKP